MTRTEDDLRAAYRESPDPAALTRLRAFLWELGVPAAQSPRNRRRWLAPVSAAAVVIAAFASIVVHDRTVDSGGGTGNGKKALQLWAAFPVDASPRPLVLTDSEVIGPANGFAPDGDAKLAFIYGAFELKTTLPTGPSSVNGQQVMTAAQALAELRSQSGEKKSVPNPLPIIAVQFGSGMFSTDRGIRSLPAWIFRFAGVTDPALVLAIPPFDRWPLPGMPTGDGGPGPVSISPDGRQLTLSFIGAQAGTGPCGAEYTADVKQSATAVSISTRELPKPNGDRGQCTLVGYTRTVTVTLSSPLGNRVVVDSHGLPIATR
jgi:hypothetical protein